MKDKPFVEIKPLRNSIQFAFEPSNGELYEILFTQTGKQLNGGKISYAILNAPYNIAGTVSTVELFRAWNEMLLLNTIEEQLEHPIIKKMQEVKTPVCAKAMRTVVQAYNHWIRAED